MSDFTLFHLTYTADLSQYYQKLHNLPGFVLLESGDQQRGRYDIVSAYPYETLKINDYELDTANPFSRLSEKITIQQLGLDLPFQGGAIGFFSYDLACKIANIANTPHPNLASMPLMEVGFYDWAIIVDHLLKKITVFAANTQNNTASIVQEIIKKWKEPVFRSQGLHSKPLFSPILSKLEYEKSFYAIHAELQKGRCYQVNYTQPFIADYTGDAWLIYEKIRENNPVPYASFMRTSTADIVCFSPERFIKMDGQLLLTSPIKGTIKRSNSIKEDNELKKTLQECEKNRAENVMIVDLMRNDLGKIAMPGSVEVSALFEVESFEAVHHLVSHITAVCKEEYAPLDAFAACFPGGSITGTPKLESMQVIAEQERFSRGVYCGSIGYFSRHGRFDSNIAIRTMIAKEGHLHLSAGGAIVIDSKCEEEYLECFAKIEAIFKGLL